MSHIELESTKIVQKILSCSILYYCITRSFEVRVENFLRIIPYYYLYQIHLVPTYWHFAPFLNFLRSLYQEDATRKPLSNTRRGAIYRMRLDFPIYYGMGYTKIFELKVQKVQRHISIETSIVK